MLTEKDYCDYETCVALKELGCIGQGRHYYDLDKDPKELRHFGIQVLTTRSAEALNFVLAIHLYDAQKWLREEKNLNVNVRAFVKDGWYYTIQYCDGNPLISLLSVTDDLHKTYEEALLEGIKEAIKILKEE